MRGRKKSPEIRAAILGCASEVFAQHQFHEVLTDDIAAKLGIGKGTIYRYFDSKEALYFATIVEGMQGMHAAVAASLRQPAPVAIRLRRLVNTLLTYFWDRRDFFILLHRHEPKLDPRERAEWQQRREEVVEQVRTILAATLPGGSIGRQYSRLAAEILLGMVRSACLFREPNDQPAVLGRLITTAFLQGMTHRAPAAGNGHPAVRALPRRRLHSARGGRPQA
ncbi:MAG TPA: TetR/AcrR family transcriptional regulator [Candidatus Binatia bacterium]|nr:TetR/AcrR family transcriptional regulator [Candidatus Binatia bacterium]